MALSTTARASVASRPEVSRIAAALKPSMPVSALRNTRFAGHASRRAQKNRSVSLSVKASLEEIDPATGEVITSAARAPTAKETLEAGGVTWAYRTGETDEATAVSASPLLFLHGVGSSSYSYRSVIEQMAAQGYEVFAPDFPGHGSSSKPSPGAFAYDEAAYKQALGQFIDAAPFSKPVTLVVQGYITAQYALLWAAENPDKVDKLVMLNMPLSPKSALPPYLAPYKNPIAFMRPKGVFAADMHNAGGIAYVMTRADADVYMQPYLDDEAANEALKATLEQCDFKALCTKVDEEFRTWRGESLVLFGGADRYIPQKTAFDFLETKRTCIKIQTFDAKVGHMPQEDYPEKLVQRLIDFLTGKEQKAVSPGTRIPGNFTDSDSA